VALTSAWQPERYLKWRFAQYPLFRELIYDARGYPLHAGKHAGIGGVYRPTKKAL